MVYNYCSSHHFDVSTNFHKNVLLFLLIVLYVDFGSCEEDASLPENLHVYYHAT